MAGRSPSGKRSGYPFSVITAEMERETLVERFWKRNLVLMWIGVFLCGMSYSISVPFLSLFIVNDLGVETHVELWAGIAFGITFLAAALISPYWGSLSDKYGRRPMLIRSALSLSVVYVLSGLVRNPYELIAVRILTGLMSGYVPSAIALIATNTPDRKVGYALGVMSTATAAGTVIGPLVGGSLSKFFGYRESFFLSGLIVLFCALFAIFGVKEQNFDRNRVRSRVSDDLKLAWGNRKLMKQLAIASFVTFSVMLLEPLLTIYVLNMGLSHNDASLSSGIIFSAVGIATIIAAPQWGKIGEKIGYRNTLMIGLVGGGIGNVLQMLFHNVVSFGVLRFVYGLFFAAVYPSLNALIVKATSSDFRGRAFSLNQSANQVGTLVGPITGGLLAGWMTIPSVFVLNGLLLLVVAVTLWVGMGKEKASGGSTD
ncbi:MAG: transporter [Paenibacillus sp.]|jgi:MFS family permease|nr:transporter [Paenibacillus sp.]